MGLHIDRLIIHDIPHRLVSNTTAQPVLSQTESPLNERTRAFFQDRIIEAAASSKTFEAAFDPNSTSPIPGLITDYYTHYDANKFVPLSHRTARHLHDSQTGVNPGGLLTLLEATFEEQQVLGLLKVERSEGVRLNQTEVNGLPTLSVELLTDLMLNEGTRIFKLAVFMPNEDGNVLVSVTDNQLSHTSGNDVAMFFLKRFLGCDFVEKPEITTRRFYEVTETFINDVISDPIKKVQYRQHLVSELQNQSRTLNAEVFARTYLDLADRTPFVHFLEERGIPAGLQFPKELTLIEKKLLKRAYEFESGITVVGAEQAMAERSRVQELANGLAKLEVVDKLKKVVGK